MGVYIKNMEMPKNCLECPLVVCLSVESDCPLVHIPPHGRMIDADALIKSLALDEDDAENGASLLMAIFIEVLKAAPTIIEAEEEK